MRTLDLNVDLAEGFPFDEELLKIVSSANIACGLHAGGATEMRKSVQWAKQNGVRIGAHPGFPDRENFGRKVLAMPLAEVADSLTYQLGALAAICRSENAKLQYVKPHGALYNQAAADIELAQTIIQTVKNFDSSLKIMGLAGSLFLQLASQAGLETIAEGFADRGYSADGSLVPRTYPNALLATEQEAVEQALQLAGGKVKTSAGDVIPLQIESLCLHGDNQKAVQFAQTISDEFAKQGIKITA